MTPDWTSAVLQVQQSRLKTVVNASAVNAPHPNLPLHSGVKLSYNQLEIPAFMRLF